MIQMWFFVHKVYSIQFGEKKYNNIVLSLKIATVLQIG